MKKLILTAVSLTLIAIISVTSIIIAQDDPPSPQSVRLENALNQQLEQALDRGLIDQELTNRIHTIWSGKSDEEQLHLYNRVCNMIQSKQRQARLENAFLSKLDNAIEQGYIDRSRYNGIISRWEQGSPEEQQQLYERLCNLTDSQSQTRSRR